MDISSVAIMAGLGVASFFVARLGVKVDTGVEDKKRTAIRLASFCDQNGLPALGQLLTSFAINDISGVVTQFRVLADTVSNPESARAVLDVFLKNQLDRQLATAEGREALVRYVEDKLNVKIAREALTATPANLDKTPQGPEVVA